MSQSPLSPLDSALTDKACALWQEHQVVVIPTETVYGLAADATSDEAVALIYATKGRPQFNPLIVHVASCEEAQNIAVFSPLALKLATHFWPGPLTLVVPCRPDSPISLLATAGLETVAIRIPAHPVALQLLRAYGRPLAAPSANRSNHISPTCVEDVYRSLGDEAPLIIEGGACDVGVESTILEIKEDGAVLLRPGGVSVEVIEAVIGSLCQPEGYIGIKAPGMLKRHYAPHRPLRLKVTQPKEGEAFIAFGPGYEGATFNLSPTGCVQEAAARLFRYLHEADQDPFTGIAVAPIPPYGLGLAINDRLKRAATPLLEDDR